MWFIPMERGTGRFCWLQVTGSAAVCAFLPSPLALVGVERWEVEARS